MEKLLNALEELDAEKFIENLNLIEDVNMLLPDIRYKYTTGKQHLKSSLLHMAATSYTGSSEWKKKNALIIKALIEAGADYRVKDSSEHTTIFEIMRNFGYYGDIRAVSHMVFNIQDDEYYVLSSEPTTFSGGFNYNHETKSLLRGKKTTEVYIACDIWNNNQNKLGVDHIVHEKLFKIFVDHKIKCDSIPFEIIYKNENFTDYYLLNFKEGIACIDWENTIISTSGNDRKQIDHLKLDKAKLNGEEIFILSEFPFNIIVKGNLAKKIQKMKGIMILPAEGWCSL